MNITQKRLTTVGESSLPSWNGLSTAPNRAMTITVRASDNERSVTELSKLRGNQLQAGSPQWTAGSGACAYSIGNFEIGFNFISIVMRVITVVIYFWMAFRYYSNGEQDHFEWTLLSTVLPMCITMLLYANMCKQDGKFANGQKAQTLFLVLLSPFVRYWNSLIFSVKCKAAENNADKQAQLKYFNQYLREESDVSFLRLFDCFLGAAPQKILQISIVLGNTKYITVPQIVTICSCFGSMAWCLTAYHRCNRYAQIDKNNISNQGLMLQLCWHFCISVSRTLCISFVASIFPFWTLVACVCHAILCGFVTLIFDRPKFGTTNFFNSIFCLWLGLVYLFSFIAVKDAPTLRKYCIYYIFCTLENIACVTLFIIFASREFSALPLFYLLCGMAFASYLIGIIFMLVYYMHFHPNITARNSKCVMLNNI